MRLREIVYLEWALGHEVNLRMLRNARKCKVCGVFLSLREIKVLDGNCGECEVNVVGKVEVVE